MFDKCIGVNECHHFAGRCMEFTWIPCLTKAAQNDQPELVEQLFAKVPCRRFHVSFVAKVA